MPKRQLVVLCDGTWNDPASNTNVWRTYKAFAAAMPTATQEKIEPDRRIARGIGPSGNPVIVYYDNGVGTAPAMDKLLGGGLGEGLSENVKQAYQFLAENFQDGDEIYVFGFSRGAYTVRSLCGFIRATGGLIAEPTANQIDLAYDYYRIPPKERAAPKAESDIALKATIDGFAKRGTTIRCLGVYDTVGALGIPIPALRFLGRFFPKVARFHDTTLSAIVENAFQALAIDERRGPFVPALWTSSTGTWSFADKLNPAASRSGPQKVLQVWFAGAHADVGGGYEERLLADISLDWMLRRAIEVGLDLNDEALLPIAADAPYAERHDSFQSWHLIHKPESERSDRPGPVMHGAAGMSWLTAFHVVRKIANWVRLAPAVRSVGGEQADADRLGFVVGEMIHESALARRQRGYASTVLGKAKLETVPVFKERQAVRRPCADAVKIGESAARLVDKSKGGVQAILEGVLPAKNEEVKLIGDSLPDRARVAWSRGNRVGLAFVN